MDDLTLEQAERCARACGWERDGKWQGIDPHPDFLDPYFWFPRLWDVARAGYAEAENVLLLAVDGLEFDDDRIQSTNFKAAKNMAEFCVALCEAIEAREAI